MNQLTIKEVAHLCGFKAAESIRDYIALDVFPQPSNREFNNHPSKNKPYLWDEDIAIKGAESVKQYIKDRPKRAVERKALKKERRSTPTLRALAQPKKRELKGFDKAMKLMIVR